jgi:hypothetical protein
MQTTSSCDPRRFTLGENMDVMKGIRQNKEPGRMQEMCTYRIEVKNKLDENAFNATCPIHVMVVRVDPSATEFTTNSDQAGLIGLLRHLHQQGFVLLSVNRVV